MKDKLLQALNEISDRKLAEAATHKKRKKHPILRAVAAVLVLALLISLPRPPMAIPAQAVSTASESRVGDRPDARDEAFDAWLDARNLAQAGAQEAMGNLMPFFQQSAAAHMSGTQENRVWSPVNGYIALAMLAELTEGDSRQQILDLLNTSDLTTLRRQVGAIWETVYKDDGHEICTLANSLWLDDSLSYDQTAMNSLAYHHYASVYQVDLDSRKAGKSLQGWLNNNTGGLLRKNTAGAAFPEDAVFTLASTVYLQSKWSKEFSAARNTPGIFHAPSGDREVTYMNKKELQTNYYWGDSFGAVHLFLKNGTKMWFFLPDEDKTVDDVLAEGQYMTYLTHQDTEENSMYMKVNLSVPKFDISSAADLTQTLQALGITDVFDLQRSNFTALTSDTPIVLTAVNQAARIIVDEQGVKAASYIELPGAGAAAPPEEIIDFILDRPFLFVIADNNGIPIFTGVVNEP